MTGALLPPADDRVWRIGAYALATLIHLPLILAVQQFGAAIAAARPPAESVITLLDMPESARVTAVDMAGESTSAPTLGEGMAEVSRSAARIDQRADAAVVAPMTGVADIVAPEAQSIADLIASDTSVSALDVRPTVSAPISSAAVAAVDSVTPSPRQTIAAASAAPAPAAMASAPAAVPPGPQPASVARTPAPAAPRTARVEPIDTPAFVASTNAPSVVSSPPTASPIQPVRPSSVAAEIPELVSPRPAAVSAAPVPLPRILIPSAGVVAISGGAGGTVAAGTPPTVYGGAARSTAVAAPSAAVSSPVADLSQPARAIAASPAPVIASPVSSPSSGALDTAVRVSPVQTPEPPLRTAAIPPDAVGPDRMALNEFVRGYQGGGCFAALTVASTGGDVALSGFSRDETALAGFQDALGKREGPRPAAAGRKVSQAQCSVLAFARAQAAYPDFPVRLSLDADRIASGGIIGGRVEGAGDRPVTLLILDDEGRIQDATFLLARQPEGGDWTFRTPLSLTGSSVPTVQLFVALAGDGPIAALRPPIPVEARRYFAEIDRILRARSQTLDVALAAFTVDEAKVQP